MAQIELRSIPGEADSYELGDLGTLRMDNGLLVRGAQAKAGADSWQFERRGMFTKTLTATDAAGSIVGGFRRSAVGTAGALTWAGRQLELRLGAADWRAQWLMIYDDRTLATFAASNAGGHSVLVSVDDAGPYLPPGLLLFGAFIARVLADDDKASGPRPGGGLLPH